MSGHSAPTPGDEDRLIPQLMEPMPMIPITPHEYTPEQAVPLDATSKQTTHNAPDLDCAEGGSEVWTQREHEYQETVPKQSSVVVPERIHDRDQVSEGAHHTMWSERSRGESWCPRGISSVNISRFQRENPRIQQLVLPSLSLVPQRSLQMLWNNLWMDLVLSRTSWGLPLFT